MYASISQDTMNISSSEHFSDIDLHIYIISGETSIFPPQRLPFYMALGVAACTVGKLQASTVFMCVCSTFRSSDFLLFVKNGFVVGVRTLNVPAGH